MTPKPTDMQHPEEAPPSFVGSWRRLYGLVLAELALLILLFYLFRKTFE
ncbi:MAG: hypothetical protein ACRDGA_06700 [Bacteroidota bacterium]